MTSKTQQIPEDFLDWCFKNTNISESCGEDKLGQKVNFIHFVAEKGYVQVMKKLVDNGIDVDSPNDNERTPLHYASLNGHLDVVELLLENGANVNVQNPFKNTPLHYATQKRFIKVAELLLQKGANINIQNKENGLKICCEDSTTDGILPDFIYLSVDHQFPFTSKIAVHYDKNKKNCNMLHISPDLSYQQYTAELC